MALGQQESKSSVCRVMQNAYRKAHKALNISSSTSVPGTFDDRTVEANASPTHHLWTMTHSMYAVMGGFAIDTSSARPSYLPKGRKKMILTVEGLKFIAKYDPALFPNIRGPEIEDKSKADFFAKCLTCLQAIWFSTQLLKRLSHGLDVSLLAINTAVHSFCALLSYFFWWWKPLVVNDATLCSSQDLRFLGAIMAA